MQLSDKLSSPQWVGKEGGEGVYLANLWFKMYTSYAVIILWRVIFIWIFSPVFVVYKENHKHTCPCKVTNDWNEGITLNEIIILKRVNSEEICDQLRESEIHDPNHNPKNDAQDA